jgi:ribosomal protein S18 acetylase RimI-like enzyme
MEIRRLAEPDAEALWNLRFLALESDPQSFAESLDELRQVSIDTFAERLRYDGNDNFVFGAFDSSALVGMAGFYREQRPKLRHKGWVWGVFVSPPYRGRGVGRKLLNSLLQLARPLPGLNCILLHVATTQEAARNLYSSLGFRAIGVEPQALKINEEYIAEEHMVLELHRP